MGSNLPQAKVNDSKLLNEALAALRDLRQRCEQLEAAQREPIAVVGMACRFPGGVLSAEDYWDLLANGGDAIAPIPLDRWDVEFWSGQQGHEAGKICTREGGFLRDKDLFDPQFFRISPREAAYMDPQQRMLLEVAWEALEDAQIPPDQLHGTDAGVFIGITAMDYATLMAEYLPQTEVDPSVGTGGAHSPAAGRLSYAFGLQGPSMVVDTACSSSLVAVHLACESLRRGECSAALAGGVNAILSPFNHVVLSQAQMLATDGRCKAFDEAANGYGRSEGVGVVVLKRLADALNHKDRILALLRGGAINQDGASAGLTAPNGPAQERLIRRALKASGVEPSEVTYVEAHGTGTPLGDPIELLALGHVFGGSHSSNRPLWVGSSKTNLGHMEAAAGMGGLIKTILQLNKGCIAPHLHLKHPSSRIPWTELPVRVPKTLEPWPEDRPKVCGVSSFGFSGTNAFLVVEQAPTPPRLEGAAPPERPVEILALSARTETDLERLVERCSTWLSRHPESSVSEICQSACTGRSHFAHRLVGVLSNRAELQEGLKQIQAGELPSGFSRGLAGPEPRRVAFLFTGQGAQYRGMGADLYRREPIFRRAMDECADHIQREMGWSPVDVLYGSGSEDLQNTGFAQPLLFSFEYALAKLWQEWGVHPWAVLGHSVGEYSAACIAGALNLGDAIRLVAHRGRVMQALPAGGTMIAVAAGEDIVAPYVAAHPREIAIAAVNGPAQTVLSGDVSRLREVVGFLSSKGIGVRELHVSHAFHSPRMDPALAEFEQIARTVQCLPPRFYLVSNVTGRQSTGDTLNPGYWVRHIREPVRFHEGMQELKRLGCSVFIEIGPKPVLIQLGKQCLPKTDLKWVPSLAEGSDDSKEMLKGVAQLYLAGVPIQWNGVIPNPRRGKAALPNYPFQRERYWFGPEALQRKIAPQNARPNHPLLGTRVAASAPELRFESLLSCDAPAYLADHQIFGTAVFPAAGFIELALAAGREVYGTTPYVLKNLTVRTPLGFDGKRAVRLRTTLSPDDSGGYKVQIHSLPADDDPKQTPWCLHVEAHATPRQPVPSGSTEAKTAPPETAEEMEVEEYYAQMRARGLEYGPMFRSLRSVRANPPNAWARLELSKEISDSGSYAIHPALLDAAFQAVGATLDAEDAQNSYLPIGIEAVTVERDVDVPVQVCVSLRTGESRGRKRIADVSLLDSAGKLVARVVGLQLLRTSQSALEQMLSGHGGSLVYEFKWNRQTLTDDGSSPTPPGLWLAFVDEGGLGAQVVALLEEQGHRCLQLKRGRGEGVAHAMAEAKARWKDAAFSGVLYFWGLDVAPCERQPAASLSQSDLLGCGPLLHLAQEWLRQREQLGGNLQVITRGAFAVRSGDFVEPNQGALSGMLRSIRLEQPWLNCVQIDLQSRPSADEREMEARQIVREALAGEAEEVLAFRSGLRWVARLNSADNPAQTPTEAVQVTFDDYGALEKLALRPLVRKKVGPGQVEIAVRAAGVNFKDVLHVLGMLKKHASQKGLKWEDRRSLGFECSGVIVAVGEGVRDRAVGDAVVAFGPECMGSYVTIDAGMTVRKPDGIRFEEAAGVSTIFLTAYHALHSLAQIRPSDKVLIHAGAGGVGQAALQLCRRMGVETFVTASPGKWDFLRAQGIRHIFNSRTLDFKEQILDITEGRGVDVVLNSLNGDFIAANLEALATGGRFVEIGKLGIWSNEEMARARPDVSYFTFDLSEVQNSVTEGFGTILTQVLGWMREGEISPPPVEVFSAGEAAAAFRHLAQAKNIGKVVIQFPEERSSHNPPEPKAIRGDRTYLITGGLGGLGLLLSEWLVSQGARRLVSVGRNAPSANARKVLDSLSRRGAQVQVLLADIAVPVKAQEVIEAVKGSGAPLGGVFHAAGVLDDAVLSDQSWDRFERVMTPKIRGAWNLHLLTREMEIDFFVCFSSLASAIGSPGQANYAAANAYLDALAHYRRQSGLPGLSVNWGPWGGAGMAANMTQQLQAQMASRGVRPLSSRLALEKLGQLIRDVKSQAVIASVDWRRFLPFLASGGRVPSYLSDLAKDIELRSPSGPAQAGATEALSKLAEATEQERRKLLLDHVSTLVARVLGFPPTHRISSTDRFTDLGLDSLSGVELHNQLEASLGCPVPDSVLIDCATPEQLADFLSGHLFKSAAKASEAACSSDP